MLRRDLDAEKFVGPDRHDGAFVVSWKRQVTSAAAGDHLQHPVHGLHTRIKMVVPGKDELHVIFHERLLNRGAQNEGGRMLSANGVERMVQEHELPDSVRFRQLLRQPFYLGVEFLALQL